MIIDILFVVGAISYAKAFFGQGTGPIHIDNVACRGTESALVQCRYLTVDNCVHADDAGVRCSPPGIIISAIQIFYILVTLINLLTAV